MYRDSTRRTRTTTNRTETKEHHPKTRTDHEIRPTLHRRGPRRRPLHGDGRRGRPAPDRTSRQTDYGDSRRTPGRLADASDRGGSARGPGRDPRSRRGPPAAAHPPRTVRGGLLHAPAGLGLSGRRPDPGAEPPPQRARLEPHILRRPIRPARRTLPAGLPLRPGLRMDERPQRHVLSGRRLAPLLPAQPLRRHVGGTCTGDRPRAATW